MPVYNTGRGTALVVRGTSRAKKWVARKVTGGFRVSEFTSVVTYRWIMRSSSSSSMISARKFLKYRGDKFFAMKAEEAPVRKVTSLHI